MKMMNMAKVVTIYLSDEEETALRRFCEDNQMSMYQATKLAIKETLCKALKQPEQTKPLADLIKNLKS